MNFFIVKDKNTELGPYPEEVLIDMAQKGDIDASTLIRNSLMKRTQEAKKIPFLKDHVKEEKKETTEEVHMKPLNRTSNSVKLANKSHRFGSFVIDSIIIYSMVFLVAGALNSRLIFMNLDEGTVQASNAYGSTAAILIASAYFFTLAYYTMCIGFKAQTFGQCFYGIMAIDTNDRPVMLQKSFLYSLFFIIFLPLEPFVVYVTKKSLHEMISGVKIVNVRLG